MLWRQGRLLLLRLPSLCSIGATRRPSFPRCRACSMVLVRWRPSKAVNQRGMLQWLEGALEDQADNKVLLLNDSRVAALEEACKFR